MNVSFAYSPWFLLLIVPLAAGITWLMYRNSRGGVLPRVPLVLLSLFRFVVLCLVGLLLLGPLVVTQTRLSYPPVIAVLQDESESLVVQRDSAFVRNEYPALLAAFADAFDRDRYDLQLYGFDTDLRADLVPDSLRFDGAGTNIARALEEAGKRFQTENLGAIVLISDGITTSGASPLFTAEALKKPVYTVLLGDTTQQRDVRIKALRYNDIAYLGTGVPIQVRVEQFGFDPAALQVSVREDGRVLATQPLSLGRSRPEGTVDFFVEPATPGQHAYEVLVSRLPNEITYRNNIQRIYIDVLETRLKIALFAGSPHPDIGALTKAFRREEGYELKPFILKQPGTYYEDPTRYNLADFDLIVLHNFPHSPADAAMVEKIRNVVREENKPLLCFSGVYTDLRTLAPLFEYMALTPTDLTAKSEEITLDFSTEYRRHSTYTFADNWIAWANSAPPLYRNLSNWQAKPQAEVFATARIKNIALDYPVFALQSYLGRKNAVFLGENFWRMRSHSYVGSEDFEQFDAWLFNLVRWLMANEDKRKFRVEPSKPLFGGSEAVIFKGQVYDDSYNPMPGVEIQVQLAGPDGRQTDYYLNETREAQYSLDILNLPEGSYRYRAEGSKGGQRIGEDAGQFAIGKSAVEHFRLQADRDLLQQVALRSGGAFVYARDLESLPEQLKALPGLKPVIDYQRNHSGFQTFGWILGLLLLLLSVEWVVRKMNSLL
ncbi:MAG: hypothetical protein OHK0039_44240 [Bacteroidia bacterium]